LLKLCQKLGRRPIQSGITKPAARGPHNGIRNSRFHVCAESSADYMRPLAPLD
jgi:hypothetical protein